jgi:E3 ubiquitin-protein ligase TRIP12
VAQTPDGTRVATPNPMRDGPAADSMPAAKASYASAVRSKPNDWHLEFSIEGHSLPLETTVYGAIHQHEARRSSKPSLYLSTIWSGVYTIRFKKVPGPAPLPDSAYFVSRLNQFT